MFHEGYLEKVCAWWNMVLVYENVFTFIFLHLVSSNSVVFKRISKKKICDWSSLNKNKKFGNTILHLIGYTKYLFFFNAIMQTQENKFSEQYQI